MPSSTKEGGIFYSVTLRTIRHPVTASRKETKGERILNRQNGAYTSVGTDRMVAWVIPQLDQGNSGDVTVAESSTLRLRRRGS